MTPPFARTIAALRGAVAGWRRDGRRVAVVPTMGALHEGHLSLVRAAKAHEPGLRVIVTIFVNPKQFDDPDDLAAYPDAEAADAAMLAPLGVDLIYAPGVEQIYPPGFATTVSVTGVTEGLCGAGRAGHFDGVATVVAKLFLQTGADLAFFGEKDFQQLHLVRRLARDLDIPIEVVGRPTVREADGLAMSSRNRRLGPAARRTAAALSATLFDCAGRLTAGAGAAETVAAGVRALEAAGFDRVEYLELRAEADLRPLTAATEPARLLAAARLGEVRLIDNVPVAPA